MQHPAQLRVCHEHIGHKERDRQDRFRWCDLPAAAWCFDEGYYVCSTHLHSRHDGHRTQSVDEEQR